MTTSNRQIFNNLGIFSLSNLKSSRPCSFLTTFSPSNSKLPSSIPCLKGPPGEVSNQQVTDAINNVIANTSANTNAVQLLAPPNADLPTVIEKLNELIQAQRR